MGIVTGLTVFLAYVLVANGQQGFTFANGSGQGGIELTIDSEASYNGTAQPALTWTLKNLVPGVDKFWDFNDVKPGDWGENTISLHIEKNPAYICLDFRNLTDEENGMNEPEALVDTDPLSGELADGMEFFAWHDNGDNIFELGEVPIFGTSTKAATIVLASTTYTLADATSPAPYLPGQTYYFGIQWCAGDMTVNVATAEITCNPNTIGNEAQTDSMSVDISLTAVAANERPGFRCDGGFLEGCTPGYWKQSQHFGNWSAPYTPNTLFADVFENAFPGKTLLEVLRLNGGGLSALGRHTVAALLNASSAEVGYAYSAADVIAKFNAVYPGANYETLKNEFEHYNEMYCPLGRAEGEPASETSRKDDWHVVEKPSVWKRAVALGGKVLGKDKNN